LKPLRFFLRLVLFALLLAVAIYLLQQYTTIIPAGTWGVFAFFFIISTFIYLLSKFILQASPSKALTLLLGTLLLRLFLSFGYFAIYVSFTGNYSISFAAVFMILYLLFTVFENYHLVINLRPDSKKELIGDV
jgi:hypothetical protein